MCAKPNLPPEAAPVLLAEKMPPGLQLGLVPWATAVQVPQEQVSTSLQRGPRLVSVSLGATC